jgi:hypothetical protein
MQLMQPRCHQRQDAEQLRTLRSIGVYMEGTSQSFLLAEIAFAATAMARANNWRDGIDALLERLGRAASVSRVYLFEVGRTGSGALTHTCRHDWAAPGLGRLAGSGISSSKRLCPTRWAY